MLSYMGMCSSGVYAIQENGAWTLRCVVYQLFGAPGAVLLAQPISALACLATGVGLINSISQYFSTLFGKLSYRQSVLVMTGFSFLVCNLGLNAILSISIPILNAIYPVAIVLILLGLTHSLWVKNGWVYSLVVAGTGIVSVIYALDAAQLSLGAVTGALPEELAPVRYGLLLGQCGGGDAGSEPAAGSCAAGTGVRAEEACPSLPRLVE